MNFMESVCPDFSYLMCFLGLDLSWRINLGCDWAQNESEQIAYSHSHSIITSFTFFCWWFTSFTCYIVFSETCIWLSHVQDLSWNKLNDWIEKKRIPPWHPRPVTFQEGYNVLLFSWNLARVLHFWISFSFSCLKMQTPYFFNIHKSRIVGWGKWNPELS